MPLVADLQRGGNSLLGLVRGDLEHAQPEDRHLDSVVQRTDGICDMR
jgi:hypothetical protein